MSVVEQYARAHILTDGDLPDQDDGGAIPVVLRYDPSSTPRRCASPCPGGAAVRPAPASGPSPANCWSRACAPAGSGEVRVWPCGRVQAVVEFHSPQGCSVVQFENKALIRFLRRTYAATAQPVAH